MQSRIQIGAIVLNNEAGENGARSLVPVEQDAAWDEIPSTESGCLVDFDHDGDLDVVAGGLDQAMLFENLSRPGDKAQ